MRSLNYPNSFRAALCQQARRDTHSPVSDLAELYWPRYDEIPKPVHVGAMSGWFQASYLGDWKVDQMVSDHREFLIHCSNHVEFPDRGKRRVEPRLLIFS